MKNKKINFSFSKLFLSTVSLLTLTSIGSIVSADTQVDTYNSTADAFINVVAPTSGTLTLTQNPSFDFGAAKLASPMPSTMSMNGTASTVYQVTNISGVNNAYTVQQNVGNFTQTINGNTVTLPVVAYYISVASNSDSSLVGSSNVNVFNQAGTIITAGPSNTGVLTSGAVSAQLVVNGSTPFRSGTYNATVTTSLVSGV